MLRWAKCCSWLSQCRNELVPGQPFVPSPLDCSQTQFFLVLFFHLVFLALLRCLSPSMQSVPVCSSAAFSWSLQGGACTDACQAPWARGDACRNGPHPDRHTCGGTAPPGSVEAAAPSLLQCKLPPQPFCPRCWMSVERCPPFADEKSVPGFPVVCSCVAIPLFSQHSLVSPSMWGILARDEDG